MRLGVNTLFMVPGDVGGTETYLRETLRAFVNEFPEIEVILFTNRENDTLFRELFILDCNVYYVCLDFKAANRPVRIILEQVKLPLAVRRHNIDLLWSPGYTAPFFPFCPQVVTVCDLQYKSFPEDMSVVERITLDVLVRGACARCDAVIAISEFSRQEIIRYKFASAEKVNTVLLGVDESFCTALPAFASPLLPPGTPFILCVAHTYPHKNVHLLVDAFNEIMEEIPHSLVIVGKPRRGEPAVQRAVSRLKNGERLIRFKEGLPYRSLQSLYQTADIFVLPSAYEGFGLPVIEAMMAGTVVVSSKEASLNEVSGNHAFSCETLDCKGVAEQILAACSLPDEKRGLWVENARKWAETFTWQKSARTMFRVFQSVVEKRSIKHGEL